MTKSTITDKRVTSVIERLEHYACNLKWTNVRGAQDLLAAADGLRELQERRKADSEPVAWTWHYREQWHVTNDKCRAEFVAKDGDVAVLPLYSHAQQAVVPDDVLEALQKVARIRLDMNDFDGDRRGIADCLGDAEEALIEVVNRRAAMLERQLVDHVDEESLITIKAAPALGSLPKTGEVQNTNDPAIPDGYVMVPMRLTAENGAKGALSGEFSETKFVNCPECFGDDECETCDGSGRIEITVPVTWTTIKEIWAKGVEHFAAAPQLPGSDPATVPGKWIPVSEQKPDCWCLTCRPVTLNDMRFVVCPDCGNKRCPRANDHRDACTGSNEPGQEGSVYPAAQQEVKGE